MAEIDDEAQSLLAEIHRHADAAVNAWGLDRKDRDEHLVQLYALTDALRWLLREDVPMAVYPLRTPDEKHRRAELAAAHEAGEHVTSWADCPVCEEVGRTRGG